MSEETMSVEPSEENGNVPLEAPSEQPIEPVIPAEQPKETVQPTQPTEPQLYELPDGRKVDGVTLAKEFKENFLPDYTRKSQALAEIEKAKNKPNETTEDPYENPEYVPKTYGEVIKVAEERALKAVEAKQQAQIEQQKAFESETANQVEELKKTDPNLNTDALFAHANTYLAKYGVKFPDLKSAYTSMKDLAELTKSVQKMTVSNIAKKNDPVSATGKANGVAPQRGNFQNARDYYNAIKGTVV